MSRISLALAACAVLVAASQPAWAQSSSPTAVAASPATDVPLAPSPSNGPVLITFSEYPVGTAIDTQYKSQGVIFSGSSPFTTPDAANPTAPVLSGSPLFHGSIVGTFVINSKAANAKDVSFDVGYFDAIGSTTITFYDIVGNVVSSQNNSSFGIQHFTAPVAVHQFSITPAANDPAGFALDNLAFEIVDKGPQFTVNYSAYIPVDHVNGPSLCPYVPDPISGAPYIPLIYEGDAFRGTYRTAEQVTVNTKSAQSYNFSRGTGITSNYDALNSPVNGVTLSAADDDGLLHDCHLLNDVGQASASSFTHSESFPFSDQAQVHFVGHGTNPLELISFSIDWDMNTVIDSQNNTHASGYVNYNHTCYPAHQIKVNDQVIYSYIPPRNDTLFITECLAGFSKVIGVTPPVSVPVR